jgi:hypothetical protein
MSAVATLRRIDARVVILGVLIDYARRSAGRDAQHQYRRLTKGCGRPHS